MGQPLASRPIGLVNYYGGFRNIAHTWIREHASAVRAIVAPVAAGDEESARTAYGAIDALPALPRSGAGDGKPSNLLTPMLACIDPRGRTPIINAPKRWLPRRLGLASATVAEQHDGLVNLIGQARIKDAFDLDVANERQVEAALKAVPPKPHRARRAASLPPRVLGQRHDEDVEYMRTADTVKMRRLHHTMTNALLDICKRAGLTIEEGSEQTCLFDALIREYREDRHLLVEVKTDDAMPMCRMAVGQLLDYRRQLRDRASVDLAVLFPAEPSHEGRAFLVDVGVKVVWLNTQRRRLDGSVRIGRR